MQDIELWLHQCEAQFRMCNIQRESTKFDYIIQALPPEVTAQLWLFILNLPIDQLYSKTKRQAAAAAYALQQTALSSNHAGRIPWRLETLSTPATDVAFGWW